MMIVAEIEFGVRLNEPCDRANGKTDRARFNCQIVLEPANHPQSGSVLEDHESEASGSHAGERRKWPTHGPTEGSAAE